MKIVPSKTLKKINNTFFLILYPGFVIYNILVGYGHLPPIFGGFFGLFTLSHLILITPLLIINRIKGWRKEGELFLILLVVYLIVSTIIAVVNYTFISEAYVSLAFNQHIVTLLLLLSTIFISYNIQINIKLITLMKIFVYVIFVFFMLYVISTGKSMFYMRAISIIEDADKSLSTYQGFSRTFLVVGLFFLATTKKVNKYIIYYLLMVFILFVAGSRSELIAFVLSGGFLFGLLFLKKQKTYFYIFVALSVISIFFTYFLNDIYEFTQRSRIFQLTDISNASSWQSRKILQSIAITQIQENPFWGLFGGHIKAAGSIGSYSHNILSAWVNYGFISFILYSLLNIWPLINSIYYLLFKKEQSSYIKLCFLFSVTSVLLLLFAKSVFWFIPGFSFGLYLRMKSKSND